MRQGYAIELVFPRSSGETVCRSTVHNNIAIVNKHILVLRHEWVGLLDLPSNPSEETSYQVVLEVVSGGRTW